MSVEEQSDPVGQTLGKRFLVRRVIGVGGMGVVYEVEHVVTKKRGALKLLHHGLASQPRAVERFVREASAAARIENPHIVETYDAGELPSGEPYMFMELLSGSALRELLIARGRLSFAEAREIVLQAADGLAAAHAAGIVHRDIKPENLFVAEGAPAYVKVLDFGISKFSVHTDHRLTAEGAPMGTPHYMSPEQVAGKRDIDERSDVYALGVVLYECVTGSVPFDAPTLPALSIKIFEGRYAPPSGIQHDAPARLDQVIGRAMAREPNERYQSMLELTAALDGLAGPGESVSLSATLASVEGRLEALRAEPRATARGTAPLAAESDTLDAPRAAPSATPGLRASELDGATPEPKALVQKRLALVVGIGAAVLAAVAVAVAFSAGKAPSVGPDQVPVPGPSDAGSQSILAPLAPLPVLAPAPASPTESSAPAASALLDASARPPPVASALDPRRPLPPKPKASAPSRAVRDGLTEENPFGE